MSITLRVGPILTKDKLAEAFLSAIREENADVNIIDGGSYYRVESASGCSVTKKRVEKYARHPIQFTMDLELVTPSFTGLLLCEEERVTWSPQSNQGL